MFFLTEMLARKENVVNITERSRLTQVCLEQREDRKRHRAVSARSSTQIHSRKKNTNTKKLIYKHKYRNTQLYNHKYANTNTQGQKGTECKKSFLKQTGKYGNFSYLGDQQPLQACSFSALMVFSEIVQ